MSSEASRLAVSIGGVEERVSSEAKLVQQERANLEKQKRRLQACKVGAAGCGWRVCARYSVDLVSVVRRLRWRWIVGGVTW